MASTNNDPKVTLLYYLSAVLIRGGMCTCNYSHEYRIIHCTCAAGCPTLMRCDKGTENSLFAACHMAMRHSHSDNLSGEKSFRYMVVQQLIR